jgi:hypothetical protein
VEELLADEQVLRGPLGVEPGVVVALEGVAAAIDRDDAVEDGGVEVLAVVGDGVAYGVTSRGGHHDQVPGVETGLHAGAVGGDHGDDSGQHQGGGGRGAPGEQRDREGCELAHRGLLGPTSAFSDGDRGRPGDAGPPPINGFS